MNIEYNPIYELNIFSIITLCIVVFYGYIIARDIF
jgi:hypothetical protein